MRLRRGESARWLTFALTTVALHFMWEMAQGGWFASMAPLSFWRATSLCARATVGDVVITAIAFSAAGAVARDSHWPAEKRRSLLLPAAIFIVSGLAMTVAYEIHALAAGQWSYAETMPTIAGVGVLPILQWLVIPIAELAVFRILWRSQDDRRPNTIERVARHRNRAGPDLGSRQVQTMLLQDYSDQRIAERADRELQLATHPFARLSAARSWWYIASTFTLLLSALAGAMLAPWWPLRLAASVLGTLMLVRTFILYHDFMHGAILPGSRMARAIFYSYAAINLTPPRSWRDSHNFHHANVGRIAGSDVGAFPLMTTEMWRGSSRSRRLAYRVIRHPLTILFAYLTIFFFSVTLLPLLRRPSRYWDSALALLAHGTAVAALWIFAGFDALFFGFLLPIMMAAALGGYLFYAQHSFPGMRILPEKEWTAYRAALVSSSYLRLGPVLRWFTGNIGFHHVHHLNSLIPFSRLPQAMAAIPELQNPTVTTLKPRDVVACFRANLWDAARGRMVRYRDA